jgi:type I restriction enzyme S subunit
MNAELLLAHFDRITNAGEAIPFLRRFVLDLAVRGKLVEQDSNDEPVAALLKQNDQVRRAIAKKDRRADADRQVLLAAESRWDIPPSWNWCAFADLVLFIDYRGKTPTKTEKGVRLITAKNVKKGFINFSPEEFLSEPDYHAWMTRGFPKEGDVLFTTEAPMGNAAVVRIHERFALAQRVICFRPYGAVNPDFLSLQLLAEPFQYVLNKTATGLTAKGIKAAKLTRLPIALPPLAEQHRIVSRVKELMALCDRLEAARKEQESRRDRLTAASLHHLNNGANAEAFHKHARFYLNHLSRLTTRPEDLQQFRQTVLSLALRGQLVPQDRTGEPASELLKHIQAEKVRLIREGILRKEKPLPAVADDEVPFAVPTRWRWARIGTLSLLTEYGTSVKSDHAESGIPVLKMGDIQGGQVILGGQKKVPRQIEDLPQLFLKRFDLLYNRTNSAELVGKTGIYMGDDDAYTFASYLIRIRFLNNLTSPVYANLAMNAPYFRATQIIPELQQQCGQANVNGSKLRSMLNELMSLCDRLEGQLAEADVQNHGLLEAVLHSALADNVESDSRTNPRSHHSDFLTSGIPAHN